MRLSRRLHCGITMAFMLLSTPAAAQEKTNDVARSWSAAKILVPNDPEPKLPVRVTVDKPSPVVIYLHGCGGFNEENDLSWARFIAQLGFIVVAPDRFARADRRPSCWPEQISEIIDMRQEELAYALKQVKASDWTDPANIFVMGFSEGADAVAGARVQEVRAAIISSWTCSKVPDIALPAGMPILSLQWDNVPLHLGLLVHSNTACIDKFGDRAGFQRVTLHGKGHASYGQASARNAVAAFLHDNLVHPSVTE